MRIEPLPNEATCEYKTTQEIETNPSIQAYLDTLTTDQQRRFREFAQHLFYLGMEEGIKRRKPELTEEMTARVLIHEITVYSQGAGEALDPPNLKPFQPPTTK